MKIIVGIKNVPDTESKIRVGADGKDIDASAVTKWIISPFDEFALEAGLLLRDAAGGGEVIVACAGGDAVQQRLREGLARGADRAILIEDERFDRVDALQRAKALAELARTEGADLVLVGKYGVGTDEGQTGPMVAELLGWPHAGSITTLELADGTFTVEREVEGAVEVQQGTLPAVLTCDKGLNEPRYPSLKGIMQAKKKPVDRKSPGDLGIDDAALGAGARLVWEALELPPERAEGKRIDGSPEDAARELVRLLHEEAKVI